ncbi:MAG: hypothetical protein CR988_04555 [Treponema sp.]|nr:MAG: hypothetical protein CR988_04555 [Treponema sp.]
MKKIFVSIFVFSTMFLSAQDYVVPGFDLSTLLGFKQSSPYISTDINTNVGLRVQRYPFAYFDIGFDLDTANVLNFFHPNKNIRKAAALTFLNTSLTFPKMNGSNIDLALFYGAYDDLNSDSILQKTAKVEMHEPEFLNYYPGNIFKADNLLDGLGIGVYGNFNNPSLYVGGYTYWNGFTDTDMQIGGVLRGGFSSTAGALNFFTEVNLPKDIKKINIGVGISGIVRISDYFDLYAATSFSNIEFKKYKEDILSHFYLMTESRVKLENFNFAIALFAKSPKEIPAYLINTGLEDSMYGLNIKFAGGNLDLYKMEGGVNSLMTLDKKFSKMNFVLSPFYTCELGNYILDIRLPIMPLLYKKPYDMVKLQLSFRMLR